MSRRRRRRRCRIVGCLWTSKMFRSSPVKRSTGICGRTSRFVTSSLKASSSGRFVCSLRFSNVKVIYWRFLGKLLRVSLLAVMSTKRSYVLECLSTCKLKRKRSVSWSTYNFLPPNHNVFIWIVTVSFVSGLQRLRGRSEIHSVLSCHSVALHRCDRPSNRRKDARMVEPQTKSFLWNQ